MIQSRDAPNIRPPKIFGRKWPKSAFSVFGRKTFITEKIRPKCCDDANRNRDLHVHLHSADHELPATFTSNQWVLIENILSLLAPFEQLTKEISSSDASVADVIPLIAALKRLLSKEVETDHGVKTKKSTLLKSVSTRFTMRSIRILCTSSRLYFIRVIKTITWMRK